MNWPRNHIPTPFQSFTTHHRIPPGITQIIIDFIGVKAVLFISSWFTLLGDNNLDKFNISELHKTINIRRFEITFNMIEFNIKFTFSRRWENGKGLIYKLLVSGGDDKEKETDLHSVQWILYEVYALKKYSSCQHPEEMNVHFGIEYCNFKDQVPDVTLVRFGQKQTVYYDDTYSEDRCFEWFLNLLNVIERNDRSFTDRYRCRGVPAPVFVAQFSFYAEPNPPYSFYASMSWEDESMMKILSTPKDIRIRLFPPYNPYRYPPLADSRKFVNDNNFMDFGSDYYSTNRPRRIDPRSPIDYRLRDRLEKLRGRRRYTSKRCKRFNSLFGCDNDIYCELRHELTC